MNGAFEFRCRRRHVRFDGRVLTVDNGSIAWAETGWFVFADDVDFMGAKAKTGSHFHFDMGRVRAIHIRKSAPTS